MSALGVKTPRSFSFLFDPPLGGLRYRVAYGGRGSAKSWQFARALLVHGLSRPLRILCAREYQASIRDSVHRVLADQIERLDLTSFYTVQESAILGANGTEFLFKGLRRDIAQIKSTEGVDVCWVEEAEAVSDHSWHTLIPTIRKPGSEIWVTFNPALESDPTYQRFVKVQPENAVCRKVTYRDNPWFPEVLQAEADALLKADPEAFAHIWGGDPWARSDAQVLSGKWMVQEFEPKADWQGPYFGVDWGFARDATALVKCWTYSDMLYVEHEAGGIQLDSDATARVFDTVPDARKFVIRADSARPETIAEMKKRGFRCEAAPKWSGSVQDGIQHLRSYANIVIHPRCKRAIEEARLWRYKTDPRTDDVVPHLKPGNDHCWDAVRYALSPLIKKGPSVFVV